MTAKDRATKHWAIWDWAIWRRGVAAARWLLIPALVAGSPMVALAQTAAAGLPANAATNSFGSGWDCDTGYRKAGNGCEVIRAPANGALTGSSYGRGWECRRGYREVRGETCVAIEVPANAYLGPSGVQWECFRGFRETDETCVAINVPANGYLTESSYGTGWKCERGYRAAGGSCLPIELPANAFLDYSGNDWECERPYHKDEHKCALR